MKLTGFTLEAVSESLSPRKFVGWTCKIFRSEKFSGNRPIRDEVAFQ